MEGWMDFLDGWMDGCFDGWMDVLMDGWMDVFFVETAQGIWYDQHGNPQAAAAQVSGIGEGLSGYVPSTEPLPASYVASERYKENERLKKELNERIKRDREEKNHKRFEELKKKWKLEGRQRQRPRPPALRPPALARHQWLNHRSKLCQTPICLFSTAKSTHQ